MALAQTYAGRLSPSIGNGLSIIVVNPTGPNVYAGKVSPVIKPLGGLPIES